MGKVEIYKTRAGWRFRIKDADGATLVTSEAHETKDAASIALGQLRDMLGKHWPELEFVDAAE